ncbi:putative excision repair cross-complementing 1 ercc1 [Heracleum sosnowskyi]|uniref:RING-type E3 ubiquitin transferase n=1 Tax=Heracleum sosnowskyi TaxID=360622 RepID=A0AAD8MCM8_9APIA|nr:putative excision repair cross-complementing 1 ercc1 [Heracleum sosnowskyi]
MNLCASPTTKAHAFLILSLFFPSISAVNGQVGASPGAPDEYPYAKFSPSMAIIIAVLVTALFFMGFFSIYLRRCSQSSEGSVRATLSMRSRRAAAARGLDATAIDALPTLAYSEVKGLHIGKGALECAVCLNEFEDEETLRLLPKCDHVFHLECIDMWLASHTTCPVCRADLVPVAGEPVEVMQELPVSGLVNEVSNVVESDQPQGEVHVIFVPDENQEKPTNHLLQMPKPDVMKRAGSLRVNRPPRSGSVRSGSVRSKLLEFGNLFPRSHSTGHSLVQQGENVDRYTLRLPEELRNTIIKRSLNRTGSCAASSSVGEGSIKKGNQTGNASCTDEGSNKGGRSYKRMGSLEGKSDRWTFSRMPSFLSRALSTRSKVVAGEGEASASTEPESVKNDRAGPKDNDPAKLPV